MSISLKNKIVTIRKEQQCFSCYRKFPIGTKMEYWVCIYEGDFGAGYTCDTCQKIMAKEPEEYPGSGYPSGYVAEALNHNQTPEQYLEELTNPQ